ncbi:MAG: OsmC family peroxiredoxin [Firmicutes bacterium]|nr:OsmC family peroxiredoxin [Bacillota bacterium]
MIVRESRARWQGGLRAGEGRMELGSGAWAGPFTFASRFETGDGANPEELLGAALAGCYSMALAAALEKAGHPAREVDTACRVEFEGGIRRFALTCRVDAPGVGAEEFARLAEETRRGCHVAKALAAVDIDLDARLA